MSIDWTNIWTTLGFKSERDFLLDQYKTKGIAKIAFDLNVSPFTVRKKLVENGIEIKQRGGARNTKLVNFDEALLKRMEEEPVDKLAIELGVTPWNLYRRRQLFLKKQAEQRKSESTEQQQDGDPRNPRSAGASPEEG